MPTRESLRKIITLLTRFYGQPSAPITTDPLELILWENVAYLVSDERRAEAFALLRQTVGTKPHEILAAGKTHCCESRSSGACNRKDERRGCASWH
jgi:hypothetical protein